MGLKIIKNLIFRLQTLKKVLFEVTSFYSIVYTLKFIENICDNLKRVSSIFVVNFDLSINDGHICAL